MRNSQSLHGALYRWPTGPARDSQGTCETNIPEIARRYNPGHPAEVTSARHWRSDELIGRVVSDLQLASVLAETDRLRVAHVQELDPAYVIYRPDHHEQMTVLREYLEPRSIFSCGRFGDWEYLNMDHAILSGKRAAELAAGRPLSGRHLRAAAPG